MDWLKLREISRQMIDPALYVAYRAANPIAADGVETYLDVSHLIRHDAWGAANRRKWQLSVCDVCVAASDDLDVLKAWCETQPAIDVMTDATGLFALAWDGIEIKVNMYEYEGLYQAAGGDGALGSELWTIVRDFTVNFDPVRDPVTSLYSWQSEPI